VEVGEFHLTLSCDRFPMDGALVSVGSYYPISVCWCESWCINNIESFKQMFSAMPLELALLNPWISGMH
jgi:hypothetical protein